VPRATRERADRGNSVHLEGSTHAELIALRVVHHDKVFGIVRGRSPHNAGPDCDEVVDLGFNESDPPPWGKCVVAASGVQVQADSVGEGGSLSKSIAIVSAPSRDWLRCRRGLVAQCVRPEAGQPGWIASVYGYCQKSMAAGYLEPPLIGRLPTATGSQSSSR